MDLKRKSGPLMKILIEKLLGIIQESQVLEILKERFQKLQES